MGKEKRKGSQIEGQEKKVAARGLEKRWMLGGGKEKN